MRATASTTIPRALKEMWRTAEDQTDLKAQAGVKHGGRVCEDPVKTMSLSWHEDDTADLALNVIDGSGKSSQPRDQLSARSL
jgi:hypothetical protein